MPGAKKGEKPKNLKLNNTHAVLDLARRRDLATVAEISEAIKLSKTTVKKIVDQLMEEGLLFPAGKGESTDEGGKKPELYRFNKRWGYVACVHVTPDDVLAATTDLNADIDFKTRSPLTQDAPLDQVVSTAARMLKECMARKAESAERLVGVVVALPGLVDSTNGVSIYSPHYPSWGRDAPILSLIRGALGDLGGAPIYIDNVNRYQAIAERVKGVAGGVKDFIVIDAIDEGVGSGIVLNGALMQGHQSLSGEVGHMAVNPVDGIACVCGARGCFEAMVSARRLRSLAAAAKSAGRPSVLFGPDQGARLCLSDFCQGAAGGDELCRELVEDAARWFLVGLGNLIMTLDPELIVLQGPYLKAGDWFLRLLREGVRRLGLPSVEKRVRIEYSVMGEDRGLIGGAAHAAADFFEGRRLV